MDILDRLLEHDVWTSRRILLRCRDLTGAQLDQQFEVGLGSVRATWMHIIGNMETWTSLIGPRAANQDRRSETASDAPDRLLDRLDAVAAELAGVARRLAAENRLDEYFVDVLDVPPTRKTFGGAIAHVLTHSHIHRGEVLHMLDRLGLRDLPEGDVLTWERQARFDGRGPAYS
jgi:uncharacterized damage-inducible protein DinB